MGCQYFAVEGYKEKCNHLHIKYRSWCSRTLALLYLAQLKLCKVWNVVCCWVVTILNSLYFPNYDWHFCWSLGLSVTFSFKSLIDKSLKIMKRRSLCTFYNKHANLVKGRNKKLLFKVMALYYRA